MKKPIDDQSFKSALKDKIAGFLEVQLKELARALPEIEVTGVTEYPVYRLIVKADIQTRAVTEFKRAGRIGEGAAGGAPVGNATDIWSIEAGDAQNGKSIEIPSSIQNTQCKKCGGSGRLTCPDCQGQKTVYCQTCRGDGHLACPKCKKTLKIDCQACEGRGKVYSSAQQAYVDCSDCGGKGSFPCADCNKGLIPCAGCGGKGRLACRTCGETGSSECAECSGKGNFVSGSCVQISSFTAEERQDIPNPEVPSNISSGEFPAVSYAFETEVDLKEKARGAGRGAEFASAAEALEKKIQVPNDGKIVKITAYAEKKQFYNMKFRAGGGEYGAWFLLVGDKLLTERGFLKEIYSLVMLALEKALGTGDTAAARRFIEGMQNVPALKAGAEKAKLRLERGVFGSYLTGALSGAFIFCALLAAAEYRMVQASLNANLAVILSAGAALAASAIAAAVLITFKPVFLDTNAKRLAASAVFPALFAAAAYLLFGAGALNFSKRFDAEQMRREYSAYFPYGVRTLVAKEDVEFLSKLVDKFEPTGIDLSAVRKDLQWMSDKLKSDEKEMSKIEQSAKNIEQISADRDNVKRATFKRLPKIYVK